MRNLTSYVVAALVLGLFGVSQLACSDSDSKKDTTPDAAPDAAADAPPDTTPAINTNGAFSTMVAPTQTLNMLTPQDAEKVCKATTAYVAKGLQDPAVADMTCRILGLIAVVSAKDTEIQSSCKMAYDACKALPPAAPGATDACGNPTDTTCSATVAEYEACIGELPSDLMFLSRLIPKCDKATRTSLVPLLAGSALLGEACQALDKKCPGVLGGISDLSSALGGLGTGGFMQPRQ
jgi:hypothetical protein